MRFAGKLGDSVETKTTTKNAKKARLWRAFLCPPGRENEATSKSRPGGGEQKPRNNRHITGWTAPHRPFELG
ncbi:hypothetical protein MCA1287 [Methylococcus capsulatus str. Bath]|jgi:hypothetical protein|uniref:Uncharacterized protein n=1 Tax=Methylococcus capsulatus (strain ATCC 33009 / NCIMB 11132 / Bath) TaxID=243233 RepID=Q609E8_METCA|nr:hypothetical protein MCA1287 [Methylococcus capsulatus str. Bath]